MAVLSYAETRRQAGLPHTQVGIEMWFKISRQRLTNRDRRALCWWLERKVGKPINELVVVGPWPINLHDPLTYRSYYADGSARYGATDGQIRAGGGVRGWA